MLNTNYNEMGMSGVNDETEIIANVDDVINIEGTKDLIPIPSSTFKSTGNNKIMSIWIQNIVWFSEESKRFARVLTKAFDSEVSPSVGCDNLLLFDQYYQMTTVRTKNRFNGSTIQRWSFISCFDDNSGIVVVYDMGIEKQITARAVSSILVVKMRESANAHLSSTVGIALIFCFGDETSRVSLSTIKEGIFKVLVNDLTTEMVHLPSGKQFTKLFEVVRRGYEVSNGFRLLVEEEMLMRKFHELMKAQAVNKKNENNGNISTALVDPACIEGDETGNSAPSVLVMSKEQL
ncbi:hypothetical protein GOBAR_DD12624 [Gossypium barbadense]|nr:hypothetical protein GOBAR_DD12624 [Gossypium barbadense]